MISWETLALTLGYDSPLEMWTDLYVTRKLSIAQLSRKLDVSRNTVRDSIRRAGIKLKGRGGPNNRRLIVTDELVEEIRRDGISTVAKRLEIDYTTLYKRLRNIRGLKISDLRRKATPPSDENQETASMPLASLPGPQPPK